MANKLKLLGICGSLRKGSYNAMALRALGGLMPSNASLEIYDIDGFPSYNEDTHRAGEPKRVAEFKAAIRASDAIIFSSPEYNYSVPGLLKNAIDWASRPYGDSAWEGKPAAIMGASGGAIGTARMQYHLRQIMVFLDMHPLNRPEIMINNCVGKFDEQGNLTDEQTREFLGKMLAALVDWTRQLSK